MVDVKLVSFVKERLKEGISPDTIRTSLKQKGWQEKDISDTLRSAISVETPPQKTYCWNCGTENDATAKACKNCSVDLAEIPKEKQDVTKEGTSKKFGAKKHHIIGWITFVVLIAIIVYSCEKDSSTVNGCPNLKGVEDYVGFDTEARQFVIQNPAGHELFNSWKIKWDRGPGSPFEKPCEQGNQSGENPDYYYCRDMIATKLDKKGMALETKEVTIVLSLYFSTELHKTTEKKYITTLC